MNKKNPNLKPWPKGVSGNPGGRPKKKPLTSELERLLEQEAPKRKVDLEAAEGLAEAIAKARKRVGEMSDKAPYNATK